MTPKPVSGPHLVAHVHSALTDPEAILDVATQAPSGRWFLASGEEVWPYWTQPLALAPPPIPDGWLDHLAAEAGAFASARPAPSASTDLLALLGLSSAPSAPFPRRL